MTLHGTFAQPENVGYLPVGGSKFEHRGDLILATGQSLAEVSLGRSNRADKLAAKLFP